jgi:hypothetical protein
MAGPNSGSVDARTVEGGVPENSQSPRQWLSGTFSRYHARIPYFRKLPLRVVKIISALILVNVLAWAAVAVVLVSCTGLPHDLLSYFS